MRLLQRLRTSPWTPALLALAHLYVAWIIAEDAVGVLAELIVRPAPNPTEWLGGIVDGIVLTVGLVLGVLIGAASALVGRAVAGEQEQRAANVRLLLWLLLFLLTLFPSGLSVRSVSFATLQWGALAMSFLSLVALGKDSHRRWAASPRATVQAGIGATGA